MKSITYDRVTLRRGFLYEKEKLNRAVTLPAIYRQFTESGRIGAFNFDWKPGKEKQPHFFWDSDVAKWMEGAAYVLKKHPTARVEKQVEALIDRIEKHQREDGYFNIYFTVVEPGKEFTDRNCHELYCAGHLLEAAVAYYEATGRRRFLSCMERYIDYIYERFYVRQDVPFKTPGHEEIELALFRLWRATGSRKAYELGRYFVEERGKAGEQQNPAMAGDAYSQSHVPIREQKTATGHAVRALYFYSAAVDLAAATGDKTLFDACDALFEDLKNHKMYVTGGIGFPAGEAIRGADYLPTDTAYCETCASIAMVYFSARLLNATGNAKYADAVETELYNGLSAGLSLSGDAFFYENPLAIRRNDRENAGKVVRYSGIIERVPNFWCSCCPPNLVRFFASAAALVFSEEDDALFVNQYADCRTETDGRAAEIRTAYPMNGRVAVTVRGYRTLALRVPGWCRSFRIDRPYELVNGYARVALSGGEETVTLSLTLTPTLLAARSTVASCAGRVAVRRGPVVYCAEEVDNGADLDALYLPRAFRASVRKDDRFGLPVLTARAFRRRPSEELYAPEDEAVYDPAAVTLIPYACYANRGPSDMLVFLNVR